MTEQVRPKWEEAYWYIGQDDDDKWTFMQKICVNDWIDKYHISMGNCYSNKDEAVCDMYDMLEKITGEDGYTVWMRDGKSEDSVRDKTEA